MEKHSKQLLTALFAMSAIFLAVLMLKGDFGFKKDTPQIAKVSPKPAPDKPQEKNKIDWTASKQPKAPATRKPASKKPKPSAVEPKSFEVIDRRGSMEADVKTVLDDLGRELIEDDVIVTVKAGTSGEQLDDMANSYDLSLKYYDPVIGVAHFKISEDSQHSRNELKEMLTNSFKAITAANDNVIMEGFQVLSGNLPTEIDAGHLWYLKNDGDDSNFSLTLGDNSNYAVDKKSGMDIFRGRYLNGKFETSSVGWKDNSNCGDGLIAIIDSGFDPDHPEFKGRYLTSKSRNMSCKVNNGKARGFASFFSTVQSVCYSDPLEHEKLLKELATGDAVNHRKTQSSMIHGHQVGAVMVANHDGNGGAGICPRGKIIPILFGSLKRVNGKVRYIFSDVDGAFSIKEAVDLGAKVINVSWGVKSGRDYPCDRGEMFPAHCALVRAVKYAKAKGVLIVSAAGNDATNIDATPYAPPSLSKYFDNVVSVAAYGPSGNLWEDRLGGLLVDRQCRENPSSSSAQSACHDRLVELADERYCSFENGTREQAELCTAKSEEAKKVNCCQIVSGSNYGITSVDVAAPGQFIHAPFFSQKFIDSVPKAYLNNKDKAGNFTKGQIFAANTHTFANGTSDAAPMVSALAGLAYQKMLDRFQAQLPPEEFDYAKYIKTQLFLAAQTCDAGNRVKVGGCINGYEVIRRATLNSSTHDESFEEIDISFLEEFSKLGENVNASSGFEEHETGALEGPSMTGENVGGGGCGFIDPRGGNQPPTFPILIYFIPLLLLIRKRQFAFSNKKK